MPGLPALSPREYHGFMKTTFRPLLLIFAVLVLFGSHTQAQSHYVPRMNIVAHMTFRPALGIPHHKMPVSFDVPTPCYPCDEDVAEYDADCHEAYGSQWFYSGEPWVFSDIIYCSAGATGNVCDSSTEALYIEISADLGYWVDQWEFYSYFGCVPYYSS